MREYVGVSRVYRPQNLDTSCPARAFPGPKLFLRHANALGDLHLEVRTNEREEKRRRGGGGKGRAGERDGSGRAAADGSGEKAEREKVRGGGHSLLASPDVGDEGEGE